MFEYVQIHERFAAEKVHFQDLSLAAVFNEEIHRRFRRFKAHALALGVVCALVGKTVSATEITVVANVDTKRLDLVAFHGVGFYFFFIQQALFFESVDIREYLFYLLVRDIGDIYLTLVFLRF